MTKYVVGFYFVQNPDTVLLIRKNRPQWQMGKLNGIGGHVELNESPVEAMRREFEEEAGLDVLAWKPFLEIGGHDYYLYCYMYKGSRDEMGKIHAVTDEKLEWHPAKSLPENIIPNLAWIVPLALEKELEKPVLVTYK